MKLAPSMLMLIVSDDSGRIKKISDVMSSEGYQVYFKTDVDSALTFVSCQSVDLVVVDSELKSAEEFCSKLKEINSRLPTINFSVATHPATSLDHLRGLTDDFFFFDYLEDELPKKAKMYIKRFHRSERFYQLAIMDFLTGCYTYRYMYKLIDEELGRSKRYGRCFSFIAIDLDDFGGLTKKYGRIVSDEFLRQVSKIMIGSLREIDSVARLNDHQFGLLLPETPTRGAEIVLSRLRKLLSDGVTVKKTEVYATFSAVLIHSDMADFVDASHLFSKMESLMERVAENGGDSYIVYDPSENA